MGETCCICLAKMPGVRRIAKRDITYLPTCMHTMHTTCFITYIKQSYGDKCPQCKTVFPVVCAQDRNPYLMSFFREQTQRLKRERQMEEAKQSTYNNYHMYLHGGLVLVVFQFAIIPLNTFLDKSSTYETKMNTAHILLGICAIYQIFLLCFTWSGVLKTIDKLKI